MAAVASAHHHLPAAPAPPSSDGGAESPIFYPLDTPGVTTASGMRPTDRPDAGTPRRGSVDDGLRRFQRASSDPAGGPPSSHVTSTKLDQEPNPFEQSFGAKPSDTKALRRARSQSPVSAARTPQIPSQPKLPPLAALASPSPTHGTGISQFGWGFDHSLRSGPLSPALLNAPANQPHLFDPNSMRTGFTPQVTQNTWGPDTPGTAAFFASLTNQTPELASTMGGSVSAATTQAPMLAGARVHRDGPNHFEANFARAISHPGGVPGVNSMPPGVTSAQADMSLYATQAMPRPLGATHPLSMPQASNGIASAIPARMGNGANESTNMYGQHNPLYLLSQGVAQHELANSSDDTVIAAAALSKLTSSAHYQPPGLHHHQTAPSLSTMAPMQQPSIALAPSTNGAQRAPALQASGGSARGGKGRQSQPGSSPPNSAPSTGGRKRKSDGVGAEKPPAAKATRGAGGKRAAKARSESLELGDDMFDDDDDEEGMSPRARGNPSGKPETDEEKRRNFLERNRQAALKCRQRKKAWLANLQAKVEYLTSDNETLQTTVNSLREEVAALRAVLVAHKDCPVQMPNGGASTTVGAVLSQPPQQSQQQRYA